jgi:hypothetical protein
MLTTYSPLQLHHCCCAWRYAGTFYVGVLNYTNVFTSHNVTTGQLLEIPAGEQQWLPG